MPFNKTKSCKGRYTSDTYIYDITEVIKMNQYEQSKNVGLINFIQSLNIYGYKKYTDIDCLKKTQYALLCKTKLDNMILRKKIQPSIVDEDESKTTLKNLNQKIMSFDDNEPNVLQSNTFTTLDKRCLSNEHPKLYKITQKDDEKKKYDTEPDWFINLTIEIKHITLMLDNDDEKQIFDSKFIFKGYLLENVEKKNPDYILLPILSDENYPFLISRITEYKQICKMKCDQNIKNDLIFDFLSNIKFICCIMNPNYNKSVFNFNKDNVKILKDIQKDIYDYIFNIFNYEKKKDTYDIPRYNIITNVVSDKHHKFITIHFYVINKDKYSTHKSIIDLYKSLSLNTLITCAESGINCNYYANNINKSNNNYKEFITFNKNFKQSDDIYLSKPTPALTHSNNIFAVLSEEEDIDECSLIEGDNTTCKLLFDLKNNTDKIEVISMYYPNNKYHTYCSLSTIIKYENNYYNFSIKSITMDVLFSDKLNEFKIKYIETLEQDDYKQFNINKIKYTKLPSCVEIIISKMDNFRYNSFYTFYENNNKYKQNLVNIKKESIIKITIILFDLWSRLYINAKKNNFDIYDNLHITDKDENYGFVQLTLNLLKIPIVGQNILSVMNHSNHFIIYCKNIYTIMLLYFYHYKKTEIDTADKLKKIIIKLQCNNYDVDTLNSIDNRNLDQLIKTLFDKNLNLTDNIKFYKFIRIYLLKYSTSYLTWYVAPDIKITDFTACNLFISDYITEYKQECSKIDTNNNYSLNIFINNTKYNDYKKDNIKDFTNFYDIYINAGFLHTFRDLTLTYYNELQQLLSNTTIDNQQTKLTTYFSFFHYPIVSKYTILHMHIYKNHYINEDMTGEHLDTTFGRTILLDKLLFNKEQEIILPTLQLTKKYISSSDKNKPNIKEILLFNFPYLKAFYIKKYYKYKIKYIKLKAELNIKK